MMVRSARAWFSLVAFALVALAAFSIQAETNKAWLGSTSTAWGNAANWDPSGTPEATENAQFSDSFTGTSQPQVQTAQASTIINGIWMTGTPGKSVTVSRNSSNGITITPTDTINGISGLGLLVDNTDAFSLTLSLPIALGASQEWRNTTENILALTNAAAVVSGANALTLRSTGSTLASSIRLNAANTFSGQLTVPQGVLRVPSVNNVSANGPLGNSALPVILGETGDKLGVLRFSSAGTGTVTSSKPFTIAAGGRGGFWVDSDAATPISLSLSGKISGDGKLIKMGAMDNTAPTTLILTNSSNDWTGGTLITDGYISLSAGNRLGDGTVTIDYAPQYLPNVGQGHSGVAGIKFTGNSTLTSPTKNIVINAGEGSVGGILDVAAAATATLFGDEALSGAGNLSKVGDGVLTLAGNNSGYTGDVSISAGTVLVNGTNTGGGAYSVATGATLGGDGTIGGSTATVAAGGTLAPGAGIGTLTVGAAAVAGTLAIEFDGTSIDKLNVTGALDISGATLAFADLGELTGGAHVFAEYGSLVGNPFAAVTGLPSGYGVNYNYQNSNQIALVSTLHPGDFDGDGDVDGADFVAWQTNFPTASGATLAEGDADGDGDVDGADFVVWQTNFPFTPGPGASPVPEPHAWLLWLLGAFAPFAARRRCAVRIRKV